MPSLGTLPREEGISMMLCPPVAKMFEKVREEEEVDVTRMWENWLKRVKGYKMPRLKLERLYFFIL